MSTRLRLSSWGTTFATRERADAVVADFGSTDQEIEVDFDGVRTASPSFIDQLIGALAARYRNVAITGLSPSLTDLVEQIIQRRRVKGRFKILATI